MNPVSPQEPVNIGFRNVQPGTGPDHLWRALTEAPDAPSTDCTLTLHETRSEWCGTLTFGEMSRPVELFQGSDEVDIIVQGSTEIEGHCAVHRNQFGVIVFLIRSAPPLSTAELLELRESFLTTITFMVEHDASTDSARELIEA